MSVNTPYEKQRTTLPLCNPTRDKLREMGKKGETYDAIINRLMDFHEEHKGEADAKN